MTPPARLCLFCPNVRNLEWQHFSEWCVGAAAESGQQDVAVASLAGQLGALGHLQAARRTLPTSPPPGLSTLHPGCADLVTSSHRLAACLSLHFFAFVPFFLSVWFNVLQRVVSILCCPFNSGFGVLLISESSRK